MSVRQPDPHPPRTREPVTFTRPESEKIAFGKGSSKNPKPPPQQSAPAVQITPPATNSGSSAKP